MTPAETTLEADIAAWIDREIEADRPTPDFWDDLGTSDRLAIYLVGLGYRKELK
jgi:hypothetical protein